MGDVRATVHSEAPAAELRAEPARPGPQSVEPVTNGWVGARRPAVGAAGVPGGAPGGGGAGAWRLDPLARSDHHLSEADGWSQYRALANVQRLAGNRVATTLVHRLVDPRARPRHWVIQREGSGAPAGGIGSAAGAGARGVGGSADAALEGAAKLTNPRFAGVARLQAIAAGGPALSRRDPRPVVKLVQQALVDIGYSLLKFHTDGGFGTETEEAITTFRSDRGLGPGGGMDAVAIRALDRSAPAAGVAQEHYVDYDRLFEDGRLDVTLALGYDEKGLHGKNVDDAHAWLKDQGFSFVSSTPEDAATGPTELWRAVRRLNYPTRSGGRTDREITIEFRLITPGAGAAAAFGRALAQSELALYAGHARRGIGPDFDDKHSAAENFVIGVNTALRDAKRNVPTQKVRQNKYTIDAVNDLEEMTKSGAFDRDKYRVWFFNACSTIAYMDELRGGGLPPELDRRNLDVFGTTTPPATFQVLTQTSLAMLEGILATDTMEGILRRMDQVGMDAMRRLGFEDRQIRKVFKAAPYFREGAGDNPVAPAPGP